MLTEVLYIWLSTQGKIAEQMHFMWEAPIMSLHGGQHAVMPTSYFMVWIFWCGIARHHWLLS